MSKTKPLFALGVVFVTESAEELAAELGIRLGALLKRHAKGDWGDINQATKAYNNVSVNQSKRLISLYKVSPEREIWIITDAERKSTVISAPANG